MSFTVLRIKTRYFICQLASLFAQTLLPDCRQHSARLCYNLSSRISLKYCRLYLDFTRHISRWCREYFLFPRRLITTDKVAVHRTSKVCKLSKPTGSDCNLPILINIVVGGRAESIVQSPTASCPCL